MQPNITIQYEYTRLLLLLVIAERTTTKTTTNETWPGCGLDDQIVVDNVPQVVEHAQEVSRRLE